MQCFKKSRTPLEYVLLTLFTIHTTRDIQIYIYISFDCHRKGLNPLVGCYLPVHLHRTEPLGLACIEFKRSKRRVGSPQNASSKPLCACPIATRCLPSESEESENEEAADGDRQPAEQVARNE